MYDCLKNAREQPELAAQLTWHRRLSMAVDAGAGLLYLHSRGIIHRDGESTVPCAADRLPWLSRGQQEGKSPSPSAGTHFYTDLRCCSEEPQLPGG